jgi:ABC-type bacteriocin/lantibiotic exporter with double-glycine peptidase domain
LANQHERMGQLSLSVCGSVSEMMEKYRWVLIEVLMASFFVQLFGLANPLMVQVIIDRVIVQNSVDTLQVLGVF